MDLPLISMLEHPNLKKVWDIKISQMSTSVPTMDNLVRKIPSRK
jgi:hypothetical protein